MSGNRAEWGAMAQFGRKLARELRGAAGLNSQRPRHDTETKQGFLETLQELFQSTEPGGQTPSLEAVQTLLKEYCRPLSVMDKHRIFPHVKGVPSGLELGWVQYAHARGATFSLGFFSDNRHFAQIALADDQGRVFLGEKSTMDIVVEMPVFMFGKDHNIRIPNGKRFGRDENGTETSLVDVIQGGIVGQDTSGEMLWLASWLKRNNRYTLEQMRADVPDSMRYDLEFRDAIAISFFYAYLLPRIAGALIGFGSGNIFRRLNREAPIGAIRRSFRDSLQASAIGMRTSGLEDYFGDLMKESGALDAIPSLEAVHGAEPLHLYASSHSGAYMLSWENGMELSAALQAMKIEGNLNRFANVSSWLERNAQLGVCPIEDNVTRVQAAQLDQNLLEDPAINAFQMESEFPRKYVPGFDSGQQSAFLIIQHAKQVAASVAQNNPDPLSGETSSSQSTRSEWVYRQSFSTLLRSLRLPFRFDTEFRSDLSQGQVAVAFTGAGRYLMPSSRFEPKRNGWVSISDNERSKMSAEYNLRVGMIMAAIAFAIDDSVSHVSVHIDSLGVEEALAQQDSAIAQLMSEALAVFDRTRTSKGSVVGSKGDPKDGDMHGDPTTMMAQESPAGTDHQTSSSATAARFESERTTSSAASTDGQQQAVNEHAEDDAEDTIEHQFNELMQGVNFDSESIALPTGDKTNESDGQQSDNSQDVHEQDTPSHDDPISVLRDNPTVHSLVTVTFSRELFLSRLRKYGFGNPEDCYRFFDARMSINENGGLESVNAEFNMHDDTFAPLGSQDEPELKDIEFSPRLAEIVGTHNVTGLSVQRADLLERAMSDFRQLSANQQQSSADKARQAMEIISMIGDPELSDLAPQITSALIDDRGVPDLHFDLSGQLDRDRTKAREMLASTDISAALAFEEEVVSKVDALFAGGGKQQTVARYFNSYAERVVYNKLFATPGEHTLLIPDNLFYAHIELADLNSQLNQTSETLHHLNAMVSYAPAYPLPHLKLAVQLAEAEDWLGARAATLNALQVSLDRTDASFAYYRFAYAAWMRDEFAVAAAAYIMAERISSGRINILMSEFEELSARARSQCIPIPKNYDDARKVLQEEGIPVWPHIKVASIVRQAARVLVDAGLFVPARTLSIASARMNDNDSSGLDSVEIQFLQSLNA